MKTLNLKKTLAVLTVLLLCLAFAACSQEGSYQQTILNSAVGTWYEPDADDGSASGITLILEQDGNWTLYNADGDTIDYGYTTLTAEESSLLSLTSSVTGTEYEAFLFDADVLTLSSYSDSWTLTRD